MFFKRKKNRTAKEITQEAIEICDSVNQINKELTEYINHERENLLAEIEELKQKLKQEYNRSFVITAEEYKRIEEWKIKHAAEIHGLKTESERMFSGGAIGGKYTYKFIPTSLGILGIVSCSCGEEFTFREIF